ncbi:MAG: hypothetical protein JWO42_2301, partial [Chloroflexi bacterium]|nr:hypothetical protein [Chloroflexota bacterium]
HPETGEEMVFRSDLPDDLSEILDNLRGNLGKPASEGALTDHSR